MKTEKHKKDKKYFCQNCGFVKGVDWDETGFTKIVCEHCGLTLDEDPYGEFEWESGNEKSN